MREICLPPCIDVTRPPGRAFCLCKCRGPAVKIWPQKTPAFSLGYHMATLSGLLHSTPWEFVDLIAHCPAICTAYYSIHTGIRINRS